MLHIQTDLNQETALKPAAHLDVTRSENNLYRLECAIDTLERLSDGLTDDPTTANALNGVHANLCEVYANFKAQLLPDMA